MKKRVFSLLLAWLMMLTLLPANALATVEPEIKGTAYFGLSAETAKPGDTIIVKIMARDLPGVAGFAIRIAFDNTRLEAVKNGRSWTKYDENVSILKNNVTVYVDESAYNVSYSHAENGYENSGELFEIKFKVKEDAPAGDAILTMDTATVGDEGEKNVWTNAELQAYNPNYESATLTISGGVTPPQHTCSADTLTEIPAKAHTCTEDGNYKYYRCTCGELYEDADAKISTTAEKVIDKAAHTDLKKTEAKEPTCDRDGCVAYWFCTGCDNYYFDNNGAVGEKTTVEEVAIPATGHKWVLVVGGYEEGATQHTVKCSVCGQKKDEAHADRTGDKSDKWESDKDNHWNVYGCGTIMNKAAHTWDAGVVTTPATCTTDGVKTYTCDVCKATKTEPIKATGHSMTKTPAQAATCTEHGNSEYYTCGNCGKFFSDEAGKNEIAKDSWVIKALGHKLTKTPAKAATCTEAGNNAYWTCDTCGQVFKDEQGTQPTNVAAETLAALGHKLTKTEAKDATCTEAGNNAYWTCETCGQVFKDEQGTQPTTVTAETIKALGHDFTGAWVNTDAAGHYHKCTRCDATDTVVKHTFNGKPCNEEDKCNDCGYVKPKGQHTWGKIDYKWSVSESNNMGCTATVKCTNCEAVETDTAIVGSNIITPATCTEAGMIRYTATFYNSELFAPQTKEDPIPALGHTLTKVEAKAATCTEVGNSEYYTCGTCGKFFSDKDGKTEIAKDSWVIKALGHKLTKTPAKAATCTEPGNNEYWTCSVCNKVFKADKTTETTVVAETLAALGHKMTKTPAKPATCAAEGNNEYYTCSVCNKVFKDEQGNTLTTVAAETLAKDPANHTGGKELRGAVAASCMTAGRTDDTYCKGCGKLTKAGDLIPPTGNHNYVDGVCTTCGSKQPADNATIKAAIEKVVADVKEAVEEVLDKAIENETDANTKEILKKLKGYVSGSSRSKLQAVYSVTMSLNGQDLGKGDSLADGQNVTIAISEETYNALKSGAKIVESYLDKDGNAQTREINATLKQVGGGYTVTFASDKTAVYGLMTRTSSGGSSGSGSSYTSGQSFTTDLPADSITRVTVNGKKLDSKYYTVSSNGSGSIVTLTDAYLATLKAGKYTVKIENKTHVSTGTFTIKADGTLSSPKTADAGIALYAMLAVSSLMGTAVVSKKRRKA